MINFLLQHILHKVLIALTSALLQWHGPINSAFGHNLAKMVGEIRSITFPLPCHSIFDSTDRQFSQTMTWFINQLPTIVMAFIKLTRNFCREDKSFPISLWAGRHWSHDLWPPQSNLRITSGFAPIGPSGITWHKSSALIGRSGCDVTARSRLVYWWNCLWSMCFCGVQLITERAELEY